MATQSVANATLFSPGKVERAEPLGRRGVWSFVGPELPLTKSPNQTPRRVINLAARRRQVDAHEAAAFGPELDARAQPQLGSVDHLGLEGAVGEAQAAKVEPHEVAALGLVEADLRQLGGEPFAKVLDIGLEVCQELGEPWAPFAVDLLHGQQPEEVGAVDEVGGELLAQLAALFGIGDDGEGGAEAGHVEALARRGEGDAMLAQGWAEGGDGCVGAFKDQIGVDFIDDEEHLMAQRELAEGAQGVFGPDQANGVVGAAQQHGLGALAKEGLEVVEVHLVAGVDAAQGVAPHLALARLDDLIEGIVDRWLDHDGVAGLGEDVEAVGHGGDHPLKQQDGFGVDGPAMLLMLPVGDELGQLRRAHGIAKAAFGGAIGEGGGQKVGPGEVHIRDPHGEEVFAEIAGATQAELDGVEVAAIDGDVEGRAHRRGGDRLWAPPSSSAKKPSTRARPPLRVA